MVKIFQKLIKTFFNAFLEASLNNLVASIGVTAELVLTMVADLNNNKELSGSDKFTLLTSQIKALAVVKGKELSTSTIHYMIMTAVKIVKGDRL